MRRLLQIVLIACLLMGSDALFAAAMPCCAQARIASMPTSMQAPEAGSCHGDATVAPAAAMSMQAAAMLRCPRAAASLAAGSEWNSIEQAEFHSPLQVLGYLSAKVRTLPSGADRMDRMVRSARPQQAELDTSLPLRI